MNELKKAIFLDRDGTIIKDKHYLHRTSEIEFLPGVIETLKILQEKGYLLFIVTNQSGIGRGFFTLKEMEDVHKKILKDLKEQGVKIKEISFCPHSPEENCDCRKPKPKLLLELCQKFKIDPKLSFMVGDKDIDKECGENAGMKGIKIEKDLGLLSLTGKIFSEV